MSWITSDIEERFGRLDPLRWGEFQRFLQCGVPSPAIVYPELPARARVAFHPDRKIFDFVDEVDDEDETTSAFVFVARDEFDEPYDLVAWRPTTRHVAAWFGRATFLGAEQIWKPRIENDGALPVFESPLEWMRAERRGIIILNPERARWSLFGMNLIVSDVAFGCRVREALRWPAPQIFVEGQVRNVA